jgi:Glycine rich protein
MFLILLDTAKAFTILLTYFFVRTQSASLTFSFTGSYQVYVVPQNVSCVRIDAYGASGGNGYNSGQLGRGGLGGYVSTIIEVTPFQNLFLLVGGNGASRDTNYGISHETGGFNGGGSLCGPNTGEGGGASDVRTNATDLWSRLVVAGGGGGGDSWTPGGAGGGVNGSDGLMWTNEQLKLCNIPNGGSQTKGGMQGSTYCSWGSLGEGSLQQSFRSECCPLTYNKPGGGGGYYGGGSGGSGSGCGSGGGSSYSVGDILQNLQGMHSGDGSVVLTFDEELINEFVGSAANCKRSLSNSGTNSGTNRSIVK